MNKVTCVWGVISIVAAGSALLACSSAVDPDATASSDDGAVRASAQPLDGLQLTKRAPIWWPTGLTQVTTTGTPSATTLLPSYTDMCNPLSYFSTSSQGFSTCGTGSCDPVTTFESTLAEYGCLLAEYPQGQPAILAWTADPKVGTQDWLVAICPRPTGDTPSPGVMLGKDLFAAQIAPPYDIEVLASDPTWRAAPVSVYRYEYCELNGLDDREVVVFDPRCPTCIR